MVSGPHRSSHSYIPRQPKQRPARETSPVFETPPIRTGTSESNENLPGWLGPGRVPEVESDPYDEIVLNVRYPESDSKGDENSGSSGNGSEDPRAGSKGGRGGTGSGARSRKRRHREDSAEAEQISARKRRKIERGSR